MCLSEIGRVVSVDDAGTSAELETEAGSTSAMLVALTLEGERVAPGDWLVVHTGMAVRRLEDHEAAAIVDARAELAANDGGIQDG